MVDYDAIYSDDPGKWSTGNRDQFAFQVLANFTWQPDRLLDIGCGNGHTLEYFKKQWPRTQYFGIDLSQVAINLAAKKLLEVELYCEDFFEWKAPLIKPFDVILLMGVAEHFPDLVGGLKKVLSLLATDGWVYLEAPNCLHYSKDKTETFRETTKGSGQQEWHLRRTTWEVIIRQAGFEIEESVFGQSVATEFVWILRRKTEGQRG